MPFKSKSKRKAYGKAWKHKNKAKQRDYNKKWKSKLKEWYSNYKSSAKCAVCGENRDAVLESHHVHPENKTFCLYEGIKRGISIRRLELEASKCIILCCKCHRLYHTNSFNGEELQVWNDRLKLFEDEHRNFDKISVLEKEKKIELKLQRLKESKVKPKKKKTTAKVIQLAKSKV